MKKLRKLMQRRVFTRIDFFMGGKFKEDKLSLNNMNTLLCVHLTTKHRANGS